MVFTIKRFETECSESVGSIALNCEIRFQVDQSLSSDRNVKYAAAVMKAYMAFNCVNCETEYSATEGLTAEVWSLRKSSSLILLTSKASNERDRSLEGGHGG